MVLYFDAHVNGTFELFEADPRQLTYRSSSDDWWQEPKPNSNSRLYCSTPAGMHDSNNGFQNNTLRMFEKSKRGTPKNDRQVLGLPATVDAGWTQYMHPHFHPSGDRVCLSALVSGAGSIVELDATVEPFTPEFLNRVTGSGVTVVNDPSYSPDGSKIAYIETNAGHQRVNTIPSGANFGTPTILLTDLVSPALAWNDPYYSPDGSKIIVLSRTGVNDGDHPIGQWGLYVIDADGSNGHFVVNDGHVNGRARWLNNTTLVFHKWSNPLITVFASIWTINIDGTGLKKVYDAGEYPCIK